MAMLDGMDAWNKKHPQQKRFDREGQGLDFQ